MLDTEILKVGPLFALDLEFLRTYSLTFVKYRHNIHMSIHHIGTSPVIGFCLFGDKYTDTDTHTDTDI